VKLEPQFRDFLREIRPTETQQEDWKAGAKTLRTRLAQDSGLKDILEETFLQGSIRRSTAIRPSGDKRPDVDIVVVTNIDYTQTTPQQAMDRFKPFLDKHYGGKWRPQGRSFGIGLSHVDMDLVITALPRTVQLFNERQVASFADKDALTSIYKSAAATTLSTLEEDTSWRLNTRWQDSRSFSDLDGLNRELGSAVDESLKDEVTEYPSGVGAVSGVFGLPVPRHKIVDAIDFVLRQALEDPCEPCLGVDVVQLAGFHERIGDCSRFSAAD